jgi:4-hydroxybenzoate polyprenyltransferase
MIFESENLISYQILAEKCMGTKISAIFRLLRVKQYYKNVILFLGVFFGGKLFDYTLYPLLILAFILVSLVSSLNYIQNDIHDIEEDKIHPEKAKSRPLASGDLSLATAKILFIIIAFIEMGAIVYFSIIGSTFGLLLVIIYLNGLLYNYVLKNHAFADIISLSTIYLWRALAGCIIVDIMISPWLFVIVFLIALFLAAGKRVADLQLLGAENASKHKKIYDQYSKPLLDQVININATSLFVMYTLYCILGPKEENSIVPIDNQGLLVYSVPVALYIIIRYLYLIHAQPEIARKTEKVLKDKGFMAGALLLIIIVMVALYFEAGSWQFLHLETLFI